MCHSEPINSMLRGHVRKGPSAYTILLCILNLIACGALRSLNSLRPCPWHFYDNIIALIFVRLSIGIPSVRHLVTGHRKRTQCDGVRKKGYGQLIYVYLNSIYCRFVDSFQMKATRLYALMFTLYHFSIQISINYSLPKI